MSYLRKFKYFFILFFSLYSIAYSYDIRTPIVKAKLRDPNINFVRIYNEGSNGFYHLPQLRPITLRDSGRGESLMFIEKTNFRYIGNIGFYAPKLIVTLKANNPSSPLLFDDPTSFSIQIHKGSVIISGVGLNDLMNDYVFNVPNAPIKNLKLTTGNDVLTLSGLMFRNKWIPFVMKGNITVKDGHLLYFNPNVVTVNGLDATKVLTAANVKLDELLKIKVKGAELLGSNIILDADKLFPPPQLFMKIKNAKLTDKGLILEFDDKKPIKISQPFRPSQSHMVLLGGDVKFTRVMPINVSLQIDNIVPGKDLDFCLYRYRDQLARGYLTLNCQGEIHVFFPTPDCVY